MPYSDYYPIEAAGHTGTVTLDGRNVTIHRTGFLARTSVGKGTKVIPVRSISAIQFKPAGRLVNGYLQLVVSGELAPKSQFGRATTDAVRDENSVVFTWQQREIFEYLRGAIQDAIDSAYQPQQAFYGPTAADRMQQLAQLHQQGLISDAEYEAKRRELYGQL